MPTFVKRILKYTARVLLIFVSAILLYLLCAFCLSRITIKGENASGNDVAIYIKTNGVHTDIVVPVNNSIYNWSKEILYSNTALPDSSNIEWLAMGWGDKGFYLQTPTWNDLKFSTAFKAAFALSTTAMHTTYYSRMTESESCKKIMLTNEQYLRLVNYLRSSFEEDDAKKLIPIITTANYGNNDAFYDAKGRYSMFKTCNSWANTALKKCGQKACLWTAFDTGIFLKY